MNNLSPSLGAPWCSLQSVSPLYGTAPEASRWLLLEYPGPWGPKVLPYSNLSPQLKTLLLDLETEFTDLRVLFIKRPERRGASGHHLFLGCCGSSQEQLRHWHLDTCDDMLQLNLPSLLRADDNGSWPSAGASLFLVCTNGKRDRCCAKFGLPLYQALCRQFGETVWQCSHFGGHKYAPTFLSLPQGICFGRGSIKSSVNAAVALTQGRIDLDYLRGECGYAKVVQAAFYFLRRELNELTPAALQLLDVQKDEDDLWRIQLAISGAGYQVLLGRRSAGEEEISGCSGKSARPVIFELESCTAL